MAEYLTETAYQRWYRQYQINISYYFDLLDLLRIRLDALSSYYEKEVQEIEVLFDEIDANLEKAIPRNFSENGKPLVGFEKFVENIKVFINLSLRVAGKQDRYLGICQEEKEKILKVHQEFKFKDKLKQVREMIESLEVKNRSENVEQKEILSGSGIQSGVVGT